MCPKNLLFVMVISMISASSFAEPILAIEQSIPKYFGETLSQSFNLEPQALKNEKFLDIDGRLFNKLSTTTVDQTVYVALSAKGPRFQSSAWSVVNTNFKAREIKPFGSPFNNTCLLAERADLTYGESLLILTELDRTQKQVDLILIKVVIDYDSELTKKLVNYCQNQYRGIEQPSVLTIVPNAKTFQILNYK